MMQELLSYAKKEHLCLYIKSMKISLKPSLVAQTLDQIFKKIESRRLL